MNLLAQETCPISSIPPGFCHCGCGGKTKLAFQTIRKFGHVKGQPLRFILGHGNKKRKPPLEIEPFLYEGEWCRRIPLTRGLSAIVNAEDYGYLMQWTWWATGLSRRNRTYYAVRQEYEGGPAILMHALLTACQEGERPDHKNLNGLDNRRSNLRPATPDQNRGNTGLTSKNTSGYKGVSRLPDGKWRAAITHKGKRYDLGCHIKITDAAEAYWRKALELRGEFARV